MSLWQTTYRVLHSASRKLLRGRRTYNLARRSMLVLNRAFGLAHEPDFHFFSRFPDLKGPFIDVGANGGQSVISFAAFCPDAMVLSFEPNPAMHRELEFVYRWLKRDQSRLIPVALGDRNGRITLIIPVVGTLPYDAQASTVSTASSVAAESYEQVDVPIRTFDSLTTAELGTSEPPEVVKIDVEGGEGEVVRGMLETLKLHQPMVLFERSDSLDAVSAELKPLGYELYHYNAEQNELEPIESATPGLNVFALPTIWQRKCRDAGLLS